MKKHHRLKKALLSALMLMSLASCTKYRDTDDFPNDEKDRQTVAFVAEALSEHNVPAHLTRVAVQPDEAKIANVNLWAFHKLSGRDTHLYSSSGAVLPAMELVPGDYEIYAIGNAGRDLGELTPAQIENLTCDAATEDSFSGHGTLPMAARITATVPASSPIRIPLERLCAKLEVTCTVEGGAVGHLQVESVQLCSVPNTCSYFVENKAEETTRQTDYAVRTWSAGTFKESYYVPENCAGVNEEITDPERRYWKKAPAGSTYLRILGTYDGNPVEYCVYPGNNVTSDFNLHRNYRYILNVAIYGYKRTDLRQSTCRIETRALPATGNRDVYYSGNIKLTSLNEHDPYYTLTFRNTGSVGTFWIMLGMQPDVATPVIADGTTGFSSDVTFISDKAGRGEVTLIVTDRYGREFIRTLSMQIQ